ncbi:MAG: hypothetical protein MHPSP_003691, partial [Paramarteilia canceri]
IHVDSIDLPNSVIVNAFEVDQNDDIKSSSEHVCPQNYKMATDGSNSCILCDGNQIGSSIIVKDENVQCKFCSIDHICNSLKECVLCDNQATKVRYNKSNECRNPGCNEGEFAMWNNDTCKPCLTRIRGSSSRYKNSPPIVHNCKCDGNLVKIRQNFAIICLNPASQNDKLEPIQKALQLNNYRKGFYYIKISEENSYVFTNCRQTDKRSDYVWPCLCDKNFEFINKQCIYTGQSKDLSFENDETEIGNSESSE